LRTEGIEPQRFDWSGVSLYSEIGALILGDWQQEPLASYAFNSQIPKTLRNEIRRLCASWSSRTPVSKFSKLLNQNPVGIGGNCNLDK
jgi:hypothetical protein